MADSKITDLVALTAVAETDALAVVDVSATETKKATKAVLLAPITANGTMVGIGTSSPDTLFTVKGQTVIGSLVAGSANLTNFLSGTPPQLIAGWSIPAVTWTPGSWVEAVFTSDGDMGIDILASNTSSSLINFSDTDDEDVGKIEYDHADNNMSFRVNASERMRIDSSGNVGIGTSSPGRNLDVQSSSGDADVRIFAQGTGSGDDSILYLAIAGTTSTTRINFGDVDDADRGRIIYGHSGDYMSFTTAASEAMRIDSSGNVGIGTSSPGSKLSVVGLPTSSAGLSAGDIWNDGGTLKIV